MVLLKVGTGVYVSADEIVLLQGFPSRPARRDKQAAESAGQYKDATTSGSRREPLRTLVHLRCGLLVGSPLTADALAKRSPVSAPVKVTTRRNNLEGAQVMDGQSDATPVERPPAPPHRRPKKTRVGASSDETEESEPDTPSVEGEVGAGSENGGEGDDEPRPPQPRPRRGFDGLKRLMGRD